MKDNREYTAVLTFVAETSNINSVKKSQKSDDKQKYNIFIDDMINTFDDKATMDLCMEVISKWREKYYGSWQNELVEFCKDKTDIKGAYRAFNDGQKEFVIMMEDSTKDSYFDYADFCFDLRSRYSEIHDFMILDGTVNDLNSLFERVEKIY